MLPRLHTILLIRQEVYGVLALEAIKFSAMHPVFVAGIAHLNRGVVDRGGHQLSIR